MLENLSAQQLLKAERFRNNYTSYGVRLYADGTAETMEYYHGEPNDGPLWVTENSAVVAMYEMGGQYPRYNNVKYMIEHMARQSKICEELA